VSDDERPPSPDAGADSEEGSPPPVEESGPVESGRPTGSEESAEALQAAVRTFAGRWRFPVRSLGSLFFGATIRRMFRFGRQGSRRFRAFAVGAVIVVLSLVTCSWGVDPASLTSSYGPPIPASSAAAERLLTRSAAAVRGLASSRTIRLTVSEAEATSALSLGMMLPEVMRAMEHMSPEQIRGTTDLDELRELLRKEAAAAREAELRGQGVVQRLLAKLDPQIRTGNVQVRFEESGQIVVAGYVQAWRFRQPAMVVVAPRARSGELELDFVQGRLGRVPAPEFAFDLLGDLLASLILLGQDYAEISELTVGDGSLRFTGRLPG